MKNLILGFAVFLISVLGCKMTGTNSSSENNSSTLKEQSSKTSNPKEELQNAFKNFRNVPFVTVKTDGTGEESATIIEQYSSVNSSYSRKTEDGEGIETIIVGSENFSRMNSSWEWKKDSGSNEPAAKTFFFKYDAFADKIPNFEIQSGGEETVNGKAATVYNLTLAKPNPEVPSLIKIWISKDSGLPLKIFKVLGDNNKVTDTFDFESKVNIERPVVGKK